MVNINLVPDKIRSAETLKVIVMLGVVSLAIPVAFWAMKYQAKRAELASVEKDLQSLNEELNSEKLRQVVAEVEQFTRDQTNLDTKRSIVDQLRKRQVLLLRLLDLLPDVIPSKARISALTVIDEKGAKKVTMTCDFMTLDAVASTYENLEASPLVMNLDMTTPLQSKASSTGRGTLTATYVFTLQEAL